MTSPPPRRCLVIHPGALGDVLLAVPALAALRAAGFACDLAAGSSVATLLQRAGVVGHALALDDLALHAYFAGTPSVAAGARLAAYEAIVCWLGAGDSGFRAALQGVGPRVIVAPSRPAGAGCHVSCHLRATLGPLGVGARGGRSAPGRLDPTPEALEWTADWLASHDLTSGEAVVLHPGAGGRPKVWPGFADLAVRLRTASQPVVVTAGPADGWVPEALAGTGAILLPGLDLPRLHALVASARAFVGNDSGPTHLAALTGCPTVALFGSTDPRVWGPIGPRVRVLGGPGSGEPWLALDAERVLAGLHALLATGPVDAA